jgi:hypothetical protein
MALDCDRLPLLTVLSMARRVGRLLLAGGFVQVPNCTLQKTLGSRLPSLARLAIYMDSRGDGTCFPFPFQWDDLAIIVLLIA